MADLMEWLWPKMARGGWYAENRWVCKIQSYERRRSTRILSLRASVLYDSPSGMRINHLDVNRL